MKIRTFLRLLGIGAIGGVAYVHTQRRGEWTIASVQDTLRYVQRSISAMLSGQGDMSRDTIERAGSASETATRSSLSDSPRSYSEYAQRKDDPGHH
jgi:hypothetical protein